MNRFGKAGLVLLPGLLAAASAAADGGRFYTARLETLALIETLNADLLSHDSATATLERWCAAHRLADPAVISAQRLRDVDKPAPPEIRSLLHVGLYAPIRYRRVRLACGGDVLSEADNWYLPALLTSAMNRALDETETPFGRAVQALGFQRHTVSSRLLWSPLPEGWEMMAAPATAMDQPFTIPHALLEHEAVLSLPDGTPFSVVVETYTGGTLAFPKTGRSDP